MSDTSIEEVDTPAPAVDPATATRPAPKSDDSDIPFLMANNAQAQEVFTGLFQMIFAIFQSLGLGDMNNGLMQSLQNLEGMDTAEIVNHPTFQQSLKDHDFELDEEQLNVTTPAALMADPNSREAMIDATVRTAVSMGIENYAEGAVERGVEYEFGAKSGDSIDCSGFVAQAIRKAMGGVEDGINIEASDATIRACFNDAVVNAVNTSSEYQVQNLGREAGILQDRDIKMENLRAGMVIGIDSGNKGWDAGRKMGIDHIGITYRDSETGQLMFAESTSRFNGAHVMPLEDWLSRARSKGWKLYGTDVVKLAEVEYERQNAPAPEATNAAPGQNAADEPSFVEEAVDKVEEFVDDSVDTVSGWVNDGVSYVKSFF